MQRLIKKRPGRGEMGRFSNEENSYGSNSCEFLQGANEGKWKRKPIDFLHEF